MEEKEVVTKLGIGLIPTRTRRRLNPGHVWIFWDKTEYDTHQPYRGFWPDLSKLPVEPRKRRELYRSTGVPAVIIEDLEFRIQMERPALREKMTIVQWSINFEQFKRLQEVVKISEGKQEVHPEKCLYSWNEELQNTHNCSSWAIEIINYVMGEEFIKCDYPKQLKYVKSALEKLKERLKTIKRRM